MGRSGADGTTGMRIKPLRDPLGESGINRGPLALIESIEWLSGIMRTKVCLQVDGTLLAVDFKVTLKAPSGIAVTYSEASLSAFCSACCNRYGSS